MSGYVEKWHANTTAEQKTKQNGCSKDPPASDVVVKRVKGDAGDGNIITTNFLSFKQQKLEKYIAPQKKENSTYVLISLCFH